MSKKTASFIFMVKPSDNETCLVEADYADLMEDGSVKFTVYTDTRETVAVFNKFDFFFIQGANE